MALSDMALPTIVQTFRAQMTGMTQVNNQMDTMGASMHAKLTSVASRLTKDLSLPLLGFAGYSADVAAKFSQSMEYIHTQAGVPQKDLAALDAGVLKLAGSVGTSPTSLSAALYHVESSFASTGITGKRALNLLQIAAEGAKMGGATVVDVVNALDAAIASGIKGVQTYGQAMGQINAIVGSGDMKLQTLADAFGTGILSQSKAVGIALRTVGAALAVFGDNNIRGSKAAIDLRMVLGMISSPSKQAAKAMAAVGLTTLNLARTLREPTGLLKMFEKLTKYLSTPVTGSQFVTSVTKVVKTLQKKFGMTATQAQAYVNQHGVKASAAAIGLQGLGLSQRDITHMLSKTGPTKTEQAYLLGKMFGGGRTAGALLTLMEQIPRMTSKYRDIKRSGKNFGTDWQSETKQFTFQMDQMKEGMKAFAIGAGLKVLPVFSKILGVATKLFGVLGKIPKPLQEFGIGAVIVLAALAPVFLMAKKIGGAVRDIGKFGAGAWKGLQKFNGWLTQITEKLFAQKAAQEELAAADATTATATEGETAAQEGLDGAMDANPIFLIIEALALLALGFYEAYKHCKPFRDAIDDVGKFFEAVWHKIVDVWHWAWDNVLKPGLEVLKTIWTSTWHIVETVVKTAWDVIKTVIEVAVAIAFGPIIVAVKLLKDHWRGLWDGVKAVLNAAWSVIKPVFDLIRTAGLDLIRFNVDLLKAAWTAAWTVIHTVATVAWTILKGIFHFIVTYGIDPIKTGITDLKTIWDTVWGGLHTAVETMWHIVKPIFDTMKSIIGDIGGAVKTVGGAFSSLGHVGGSVLGTAGSVVKNVFTLGGLLATGGAAEGGKTYIVGETGPELVQFGANAMVTPTKVLSQLGWLKGANALNVKTPGLAANMTGLVGGSLGGGASPPGVNVAAGAVQVIINTTSATPSQIKQAVDDGLSEALDRYSEQLQQQLEAA